MKQDRNMNARNFGLRTSNINRALVAAYQLKNGNGFVTKCSGSTKSQLNQFGNYLKEEHGIKDLRKVEKSHVQSYADHLKDKYESGEFTSASAPQNYLSKINVALEYARCDQKCRLEGVREAGLPKKSGIADRDHSTPDYKFEAAKLLVPDRLAVQYDLQKLFGLRFEESAKIDAKKILQNAEKTGFRAKIKIKAGTKGGKERYVPFTSESKSEQISALRRAAEIQQNDPSLIPADLKYHQYQSLCYRETAKTEIHQHGNRHCYPNNRYENITGVQSPVRAGIEHGRQHIEYIAKTLQISISDARKLDKSARLKISGELGHVRPGITNAYLG